MKRRQSSEEQIIGTLNEAGQTSNIREVCRVHNITETTLYRWPTKFGGMEVSDAKRLIAAALQIAARDGYRGV